MQAYQRSNRCMAYCAGRLLGFIEWACAVTKRGSAAVPGAPPEVAAYVGDAFADALGLVLGDGHVDVGGQVADRAAIGDHADLGAGG
jgi:hypothetical protein